jgi:hypothetical protein
MNLEEYDNNPWLLYEAEKRKLEKLPLTREQYDAAIEEILDRLGL